ncbi:hypothetical protein [Natronobeatus ordinarius]|uniref:hypothetical protein n=1 Tax=Natronobeatus ordinarius TaxID=2963433 RepID=UPI0020CF09DE|nr:hypothetical protein [Natronobeatus ordinarius]
MVIICASAIGLTVAGGSPAIERYGITAYEVGLVLLIAGGTLAGIAAGRYGEYRQFTAGTASTVRDSFDGDIVTLTGTVAGTAGSLLQTPYSNTPCVAYDARLETNLRAETDAHTFWTVDDRSTDHQQFLLEDDTGTIAIDPTDSRLTLPTCAQSDAQESVSMAHRLRYGRANPIDERHSRYTEHCLQPGDTVGVLGRVTGSGSERTVDATAIFSASTYGETLTRTVSWNGAVGVVLFVVGFLIMIVTSGVV